MIDVVSCAVILCLGIDSLYLADPVIDEAGRRQNKPRRQVKVLFHRI